MKKEKMITRTMFSTVANVKFFDCNENNVKDAKFVFCGKLENKDIELAVKDEFENDFRFGNGLHKFVMINSVSYQEKLYGVTESDFMKLAVELPPRKVNNAQEDE